MRFGAPLENWTYEEIRDNLGQIVSARDDMSLYLHGHIGLLPHGISQRES